MYPYYSIHCVHFIDTSISPESMSWDHHLLDAMRDQSTDSCKFNLVQLRDKNYVGPSGFLVSNVGIPVDRDKRIRPTSFPQHTYHDDMGLSAGNPGTRTARVI